MMSKQTLIIGKNGKTGARVNRLLTRAGHQTRALSRATTPAFDWRAPEFWLDTMEGCDAAYVCFQPDLAVPAAQAAIRQFIRLAKIAGIEHIVLLSGRGEAGAQLAEQQLINSGLRWNVVRASWFAQNFSEGFMIEGILNGQVALPAGNVLEPFVDVDDIAEVAAACLTSPELNNQLFEVTGPELMTFRDCVETIAHSTNRSIEFIDITCEQFVEGMRLQGMPEDMLWLINELFSVVMDGRNSQVTNGVEQALGRPARSFHRYALKAAAAGAWVSPVSPVSTASTAKPLPAQQTV